MEKVLIDVILSRFTPCRVSMLPLFPYSAKWSDSLAQIWTPSSINKGGYSCDDITSAHYKPWLEPCVCAPALCPIIRLLPTLSSLPSLPSLPFPHFPPFPPFPLYSLLWPGHPHTNVLLSDSSLTLLAAHWQDDELENLEELDPDTICRTAAGTVLFTDINLQPELSSTSDVFLQVITCMQSVPQNPTRYKGSLPLTSSTAKLIMLLQQEGGQPPDEVGA